jgi:hypothetical protein
MPKIWKRRTWWTSHYGILHTGLQTRCIISQVITWPAGTTVTDREAKPELRELSSVHRVNPTRSTGITNHLRDTSEWTSGNYISSGIPWTEACALMDRFACGLKTNKRPHQAIHILAILPNTIQTGFVTFRQKKIGAADNIPFTILQQPEKSRLVWNRMITITPPADVVSACH